MDTYFKSSVIIIFNVEMSEVFFLKSRALECINSLPFNSLLNDDSRQFSKTVKCSKNLKAGKKESEMSHFIDDAIILIKYRK